MNDPYFDDLRKALRGLPAAEVEDIVSEMAAHVEERAEIIGMDAALQAFGDPRDIAIRCLAERRPSGPSRRGPWGFVRALRPIVGLGGKWLGALAASIAGYGLGGLFIAMAIVKPFTPERIGLWIIDGDDPGFSLGRTTTPLGEELLGWWVMPIGLLLGTLVLYLTWRVSLSAVRSTMWTGRHGTQDQERRLRRLAPRGTGIES